MLVRKALKGRLRAHCARATSGPRPSERPTTRSAAASSGPARLAHPLDGLRALERPRATQYVTGVSAEAQTGAERHIRYTSTTARGAAERCFKSLHMDHNNQREGWDSLLKRGCDRETNTVAQPTTEAAATACSGAVRRAQAGPCAVEAAPRVVSMEPGQRWARQRPWAR